MLLRAMGEFPTSTTATIPTRCPVEVLGGSPCSLMTSTPWPAWRPAVAPVVVRWAWSRPMGTLLLLPLPRIGTSPSSPSAPASTLGVLPVDWWVNGRGWKPGKTEAGGFSRNTPERAKSVREGWQGGNFGSGRDRVPSQIFAPKFFQPFVLLVCKKCNMSKGEGS